MANTGSLTKAGGMLSRLARTRSATRIAMIVERGWPLALPFVIAVSAFLIVSWFGVFRWLPDWAR
jgi:hypothetical protein